MNERNGKAKATKGVGKSREMNIATNTDGSQTSRGISLSFGILSSFLEEIDFTI
jgi:hypothetical protein